MGSCPLVGASTDSNDGHMSRIEITRREDLVAVCPHCEAELPEIFVKKPRGPFGIGQGYLFLCPTCRKVLGTGVQWYPFPARN